ncbi:MAG: phosphatidylglycerophosphatase A [Rickettsiaceae bacterium]
MNYMHKIAEFFVTVCYIGKIKIAPGTFGSLVAFPLCYIIMNFTIKNQLVFQIVEGNQNEQQFLSLFLIEIFATLVLFIVGTYFTSIYIKNMKEQDPKEVVIDEVVGQMLVVILSSFSVIFLYSSAVPQKIDEIYTDFIFLFLVPFVLFRVFDIFKPWPINWFDSNVKGAFGVMIDDVVAAFFATVTQYVIVFTIIGFFPLQYN